MCALSQYPDRVTAIMILVYGDESFDETQERVCALSGIVGTERQWAALEAKWVDRNGDIPFHAKDCESDWGGYKGKSHQDNQDRYKDLAILLAESGLYGIGVSIDLVAARAAFPSAVDLAYYKAFWHVLDAMQDFASKVGEVAKFTFASRIESDYNARALYSNLRNSIPKWKESLADELSLVSAESNPRVQAGDLLAREAMKAVDHILGPVKRRPRKSWEALGKTGRFIIEPLSSGHFEDLRNDRDAKFDELVGRSEEYRAWLAAKKRQDNYTNLLMFMGTKKHYLLKTNRE